MTEIHEETPVDREGIRNVTTAAFGRIDESLLIDRLRDEGAFVISLVATNDGQIIGHALFSHVSIEMKDQKIDGVCLAPVSVLPIWQSKGIGSGLIMAGLDSCRSRGEKAAVVLGDSKYYPRFGFTPQFGRQLQSSFSHKGDAWMGMEQNQGALTGITGIVRFPKAFKCPG